MAKRKLQGIEFINAEESARKRRLLQYIVYVTFPITGLYAVMFYYNQVYLNSAVQMACCIGFVSMLWFLKRNYTTISLAWYYITLAGISIYFSIYFTGGLMSVGVGWLVTHAPIALLIGSRKHGFVAAVADFIFIISLVILHSAGYEFPPIIAQFTSTISNIFSVLIGLVGLMFLVSLVFENGKNCALLRLADKNTLIDEERKRSDELLLNILPVNVALELKKTGITQARKYEQATIFFCDFIAFSKIAESLPPEKLVVIIDQYFRAFDDIMDNYGIEKIKTIGDAYLAVSGIPDERTHNPVHLLKAAREILNYVTGKQHETPHFGIRIGINTGTVVAGVVGRSKFAFDIWGDAVNIAARMEEKCEANQINISESTFNLVSHEISCTYRGAFQAKNKGTLKMYQVD